MEFEQIAWGDPVVTNVALSIAVVVGSIVIALAIKWPFTHVLDSDKSGKVGGSIFVNLARILIYGWAICTLINLWFGIDMVGLIGALGVVGIAVSLGAQQTIANIIGGVIVSLSQMIGLGDWVTVQNSKEACVIDTNWRRTTLQDEDGVQIIVPNSLVVSNIVEKGNPYYMIVVPFSLKTSVPDVRGLLVDCEQVLLDAQIADGLDYEAMRPKAHVQGASLGSIQAEVKIYANRKNGSRTVKRAILPALVELLQERDALAEIHFPEQVYGEQVGDEGDVSEQFLDLTVQ